MIYQLTSHQTPFRSPEHKLSVYSIGDITMVAVLLEVGGELFCRDTQF